MAHSVQQKKGFRFVFPALVALLFVLAAGLRLYGIGHEGFWTDEVFSVQFSDGSIGEVLEDNARDVHPPLYYLGLYFWRGLLGDSDARVRAYSTAWSLLGLLAVFLLALDMAGRRAAAIALLLGAVNPQDIYFAQEARMYSQAAALCMLAAWCLWWWMERAREDASPRAWAACAVGYGLCAAGALLTHYVSAAVLLAQGTFALIVFARRGRRRALAGYLASAAGVVLLFLPWYLFVSHVRGALYSETLGWIRGPSLLSCVSFLGREFFWGNVWTVHNIWWPLTLWLAVTILGVSLLHAWESRSPASGRRKTAAEPRGIVYAAWLLAGPVFIAALVSVFYHPVYHRSRFALFVLPPFLILAGIACDALRGKAVRWIAVTFLAGVMLAGTIVQHRTEQKTDWRSFAAVWREQGPPAAIAFFPGYFDRAAAHVVGKPLHSAGRDKLEPLLPFLGGSEIWICSMAGYEYESDGGDGGYYRWLTGLGRVRSVSLPTNLELQIVTIAGSPVPAAFRGRFDRWHPPLDQPGRIEGFEDPERFHALEFDAGGMPCRWSTPKAWLRLKEVDRATTVVLGASLPPGTGEDYRADLSVYLARAEDVQSAFDTAPVCTIPDYRPGPLEIELPIPAGSGDLVLGWALNGVNPAHAGISEDRRDLGLLVCWVGLIGRGD